MTFFGYYTFSVGEQISLEIRESPASFMSQEFPIWNKTQGGQNNAFHEIQCLARNIDWAKGGVVCIPCVQGVHIFPAGITESFYY